MMISDIKERLAAIRECAGDWEAAHGMEDDLMREFIEYMAESAPPFLKKKAALVLTSKDIEFPRYCA